MREVSNHVFSDSSPSQRVTREISLDLTPQAEVGSYVLVHAGFAIEVVDEQFAQETLDLVKSFPELADLEGV